MTNKFKNDIFMTEEFFFPKTMGNHPKKSFLGLRPKQLVREGGRPKFALGLLTTIFSLEHWGILQYDSVFF